MKSKEKEKEEDVVEEAGWLVLRVQFVGEQFLRNIYMKRDTSEVRLVDSRNVFKSPPFFSLPSSSFITYLLFPIE
jgi:hypothetical protein